ncbi:MAG TPA: L,D-transpeptidase [Bryobacteraceae bacterium]|nr:L,D-transpeptidase [Bryobacteraceae bacterium]
MTKLAAVLLVAAVDAAAEERRQAQRRIVISIPDRKLVLFDGDRVEKIYDVAVGKPSTPTPTGEFRIINHIPNPTYYGPAGAIAPGKDNPVGTRWMGLSVPGYGIHGTNVPSSIGKTASHGCIRMRQQDLEELFDLVNVGVTVELRGESSGVLAQVLAGNSAFEARTTPNIAVRSSVESRSTPNTAVRAAN